VIGKLASCAAMAMTVAAYVAPTAWQRPVAIGVVALLTAVTCFGVTRTARLTQALVAVTLLGLVVVLAAAGRRRPRALLRRSPSAPPTASCRPRDCSSSRSPATRASRPWARRCATPRAPFLAPSGSRSPPCSSYVLVGAAVVLTLGGAATTSAAPLVGVVDVAGWPRSRARDPGRGGRGRDRRAAGPAVGHRPHVARDGAERDLPSALAAIDRRHHVPRRAQLTAGAVVVAVVAVTDLRGAIGFSSFGVLLYYLVANLSAAACSVRCSGVGTTARRMARPGRGRHRLSSSRRRSRRSPS
jgi:APA family basic amino acid/polyamine antiporter